MRQAEAKTGILREWRLWREANLSTDKRAGYADAMRFFGYLQKERPGLLRFRYRGDKFHAVHAWLVKAGVVYD